MELKQEWTVILKDGTTLHKLTPMGLSGQQALNHMGYMLAEIQQIKSERVWPVVRS